VARQVVEGSFGGSPKETRTPWQWGSGERDSETGAAFLPCEAAVGATGIAAALDPHAAAIGLSPVLLAQHLPVGLRRRIRHGAAEAEVWPGSWAADHITIADPAQAPP
jgi:hypothetical protein